MLNLGDLNRGFPAITSAFGQYLAEAGAVCLASQGHQIGKEITVTGIQSRLYSLFWPDVTDQMKRCHNDPQVATEHGAMGIAILLIKDIVGYSVIDRSRKGTGFDYWLGDETELPFQNKSRLEISGIREGNSSKVSTRVKKKIKQTTQSDNLGISAYVVVVEFGQPIADVRKR